MTFNSKEQQIIKWASENGKGRAETEQALVRFRTTGSPSISAQVEQPSFLQDLGGDIKETVTGIKEQVTGAGERVVERLSEEAPAPTMTDRILQTAQNIVGAGSETFKGISRTFGEAFIGAGKAVLPQRAEEKVKEVATEFVEKVVSTDFAQDILGKYNSLSDTQKQGVDDALGYGEGLADLITLGGASKLTKPILNKVKTVVDTASEQAGKLVSKTGEVLETGLKKATPQSADIMNRVARLKPKDANSFQKMAGKTHGQYLSDTGNFGSPDKILKIEAEKFSKSKTSVDEALAGLDGQFKDGSVTDALTGLVEKAKSVSSENIKAPYLNEVIALQKKYDTSGLTMAEINQVKRLYERNVKLSFNKLINADKVEQATNIDNAMRSWQVKQAQKLGFENIAELNKQTQISRFMINKLGDQVIGKSGLNGINLTDWIVLSGGNPASVAGFLTKKFLSSKSVQARIAELLNKSDVQDLIKPKITRGKQI